MHDHTIDCTCDTCRYLPECRGCRANIRNGLYEKCQSCYPRPEPVSPDQLALSFDAQPMLEAA